MEHVNIGIFGLDDDHEDLELLKRAIEKSQRSTYHLYVNEEEFLSDLTEDIHVYVIDHTLRARTGLDVLKLIKAKNRESYVIAYTGISDPKIIIRYIKAKVDDWVNKNDNDFFEQLVAALRTGITTAMARISLATFIRLKMEVK